MWFKWLPWKYIVRRLARSHGFLDPIAVLSHLRRFAQPSEVNEPIELLRSGVVMHARGLLNSRVIQHNLDWVWPYWVNHQFEPHSEAFIPRAFSLTHINLSARNWTAVGVPGFAEMPVVDPRGLVMPFWDSWAIDVWVLNDQGTLLAPSRLEEQTEQKLIWDDNLSIVTNSGDNGLGLTNEALVELEKGDPVCTLNLTARSQESGWLVVSLRPYNTEGVSFIHKIEYDHDAPGWRINDKQHVRCSDKPDKHLISEYHRGDVVLALQGQGYEGTKAVCDVGMATAAAMYRIEPTGQRQVTIQVPLGHHKSESVRVAENFSAAQRWTDALNGACAMTLPYRNYQFLYDAAIRSMVLHVPDDVYPGPYTYKRFWFRDAAFIVYALARAGMITRAENLIDRFFARQTALGFFHSQQGEWDSNGQVLWVMEQFCRLAGTRPKESWLGPVVKGAKWIAHKRTHANISKPHAGLLPAGFSAEHLGPNDYYYWDDFWAVAGLRAAARMLMDSIHRNKAAEFAREADDLLDAIEWSLATCSRRLGRPAMPASPYRRLDSGAIGSIVAGYPLDLLAPEDERLQDTGEYLLDNCMVDKAFFHDIAHSGINPYLTLELAQVRMRQGDHNYIELVDRVAELASPTGQWPEAINPRTTGGCMGDGQHIWASAEWALMMMNAFVLPEKDKLLLGTGIVADWVKPQERISLGPFLTAWGPVTVSAEKREEGLVIQWQGQWRDEQPPIEIRVPGYDPVTPGPDDIHFTLARGAVDEDSHDV